MTTREKSGIRFAAAVILMILFMGNAVHTESNQRSMISVRAVIDDVKHSTVHYQYQLRGITYDCKPHLLEAKARAEYPIGLTRMMYIHPSNYLHCMDEEMRSEYSNFGTGVLCVIAVWIIFLFLATFVDDKIKN